jgi:hypothetical protein
MVFYHRVVDAEFGRLLVLSFKFLVREERLVYLLRSFSRPKGSQVIRILK